MSEFRRGTIAINEVGRLGFIVWQSPVGVPYYHGFELTDDLYSDRNHWESISPTYVCHVSDLLKRIYSDTFTIESVGPRVVTMPHGLTPCPALATPQRDDDPVHDCSGGEIDGPMFEDIVPIPGRPLRRSCI